MPTKRAERRRARQAIDALRAMESDARRMARRLPKDARARARLESAADLAGTSVRSAQGVRRSSPSLAAARAEYAAARLDRASGRYAPVPAGARRRTLRRHAEHAEPAGAVARAEQRAQLIRRRRKQAEQVRKMATRAAALSVGQAVVVPKRGERARRG